MRRYLSMSFLLIALMAGVFFGTGTAQSAAAPVAAQAPPAGGKEPANYVLGPKDTLSIWAREPAEVNSANARIDLNGFVNLPLVERVQAAGLTVEQFTDELIAKLKKYVVNPQVIVNIVGVVRPHQFIKHRAKFAIFLYRVECWLPWCIGA